MKNDTEALKYLIIVAYCFVFIVSVILHYVYYKKRFITYFHFWKHHIPMLEDSLFQKQDHIQLSPKYRVAGEICRTCGNVRRVTKRFSGQDEDGWAKKMCEELGTQRFDNAQCGGDVVLPEGVTPWE